MAKRRRRSRDDDNLEMDEDSKIVLEAQERFKICMDWESDFQTAYKDDVKFANGDSDNGWQWPRDLKTERQNNKRPALTVNKIAPMVQLIVNDARQNKPSISIKPTGDQTSFEAATMYEGIVRNIEYVSKAQAIYDEAVQSSVEGGIGWWRVDTKYVSPDSFDQEIVIGPVKDQLGVFLDPFIKQPDGSDADYGFVFEDVPRKLAESDYPDMDISPLSTSLGGPDTWVRQDSVRIAEYYRIAKVDDELVYMVDAHGNESTFYKSEVPKAYRKAFRELLKQRDKNEPMDGEIVTRKVQHRKLEWFKIAGNTIIDRRVKDTNELKWGYVPLVRVVGQERVIDGKLVRRGHVRMLKDPQRMYNYNTSAEVEQAAMASKTQWVGPKDAFSGNEQQWNNMNLQNAAYVTYNWWDDERNQQIPKPERLDPARSAQAYLDGMKIAEHELEMASGQYASHIDGTGATERSGKAIDSRQRMGDTVTYHFIDHLAMAIRFTGVLVLDIAPQVYDTKRVLQIMGKDGKQSRVEVNPEMEEAYTAAQVGEISEIMFNPKIGKYLVEADIGPAYATQRQEAWNAFVQIVTANGELVNEIGDLMFRSADFPLADKIAERLHRKIKAEKPYLFDDNAPTPAMQGMHQQQQQMQQEIQSLSKEIEGLLQSLAEKRLKLIGKEQLRDIEAYDSVSKRITAMSNAQPELSKLGEDDKLKATMLQLLGQIFNSPDIQQEVEKDNPDNHQQGAGAEAPGGALGGLMRAPDGAHYVADPNRPGKYMKAEPNPTGQA